jgi:hypothetical protein
MKSKLLPILLILLLPSVLMFIVFDLILDALFNEIPKYLYMILVGCVLAGQALLLSRLYLSGFKRKGVSHYIFVGFVFLYAIYMMFNAFYFPYKRILGGIAILGLIVFGAYNWLVSRKSTDTLS